jgi:hypothetical protein
MQRPSSPQCRATEWPQAGQMALVQIRGGPDSGRFARFDWDGSDYAVRAACQISGILAVRPAILPILN